TRLSDRTDSQPAALGVNLYRIAQEAHTNEAKHANASHILLQLTVHDAPPAPEADTAATVELRVDDDGRAGDAVDKSGMGLLGMRERVTALGGRLTFECGTGRGSCLHVSIPMAAALKPPSAGPSAAAECAA
ncbi:MAG: hypothetical protein V7634_1895, partial [Bradyrhizobium sp.]